MEQNRFHRYREIILVFILAMIGINPMPERARLLISSASGETLSQQVAHDVERTPEILASSVTLQDWQTSGFMPADILKNAFALHSSDARDAVCETLDRMSPENLSIFENALRSQLASQNLKCASALLEKIQAYWVAQTASEDAAELHADPSSAPPPSIPQEQIAVSASMSQISSRLLKKGLFALVFEGHLSSITTRQILETLENRGVHATFVMPGSDAQELPELVRDMAQDGNLVGSQGTHLADLSLLDTDEASQEISNGMQDVSAAAGAATRLFAFPGVGAPSEFNTALGDSIRSQGFVVLRGDLDAQDWKTFDAPSVIQASRNLIHHHDRGILVLQSGLHQTAIALPAILDEISAAQDELVIFPKFGALDAGYN